MKILLALYLALAAGLILTCGCFKQNIQDFVVRTPQMETRADAERVVSAAKSISGVLDADANLDDRTVTVRYNSLKLAEKNVETAIAKAGYDANSILALPDQSQ